MIKYIEFDRKMEYEKAQARVWTRVTEEKNKDGSEHTKEFRVFPKVENWRTMKNLRNFAHNKINIMGFFFERIETIITHWLKIVQNF